MWRVVCWFVGCMVEHAQSLLHMATLSGSLGLLFQDCRAHAHAAVLKTSSTQERPRHYHDCCVEWTAGTSGISTTFSHARETIRTDGQLEISMTFPSRALSTATAPAPAAASSSHEPSTQHSKHEHVGQPTQHGAHSNPPHAPHSHSQSSAHSQAHRPRGPAPVAEPVTDEQLQFLVDHITRARNVLVITGRRRILNGCMMIWDGCSCCDHRRPLPCLAVAGASVCM